MELGPRRCVPIRDVSSFQRVICTGFNGFGTWRCGLLFSEGVIYTHQRCVFPYLETVFDK